MADERMTLLDIAKKNGSDALVGLIDEVADAHPELELGAARTIRGLNYKTLVRIGNPGVGFRNANEGVEAVKGTYENRLVETFILEQRIEADKAVADRDEDGAAAAMAREAAGVAEAVGAHLASQFYYGTTNDSKGFPGLLTALDTVNMEVDATGNDANKGSSVWAVKFGPRDVQWVWGADGTLDLGDVIEALLEDSTGKKYQGYYQNLLAYPGLAVHSKMSVGRIKNLTDTAGKGLTDDLLATLLMKFQERRANLRPDVLLMTPRSLEQLRSSRTATNATGAPAPIPTEFEGVPIRATNSIKNTEAIA